MHKEHEMYGMIGTRAAYLQQQALDRQEGYSTEVEPQQNIMGLVARTAEIQGDSIADLLTTVSLFLDRFFGPQPEATANPGAATPQPSGMFHEVERNLSRNGRLLGELEQKVRRLSDIA